jgi:hypothetical protein
VVNQVELFARALMKKSFGKSAIEAGVLSEGHKHDTTVIKA